MAKTLETRYPCPVCLGVTLRKLGMPGADGVVILDHCARCGGVWFDAGEVQALRRCKPDELLNQIGPISAPHRMQCHSCRSHIGRTEETCSVCGWDCKLQCPLCQHVLEQASHSGIQLDVCRTCKGVWFDRHELETIWKAELTTAVHKRTDATGPAGGANTASLVLLEALTYNPFLTYYAASAGIHVLGASAGVLAHAPSLLSSAGGALADAAEAVFEAIVEILNGL